jgi:hypothetical protein
MQNLPPSRSSTAVLAAIEAQLKEIAFMQRLQINALEKLAEVIKAQNAEMKSNYLGYEGWAKQLHEDGKRT